jgi:hypothetical protein
VFPDCDSKVQGCRRLLCMYGVVHAVFMRQGSRGLRDVSLVGGGVIRQM